jgi:hypothetical protein
MPPRELTYVALNFRPALVGVQVRLPVSAAVKIWRDAVLTCCFRVALDIACSPWAALAVEANAPVWPLKPLVTSRRWPHTWHDTNVDAGPVRE